MNRSAPLRRTRPIRKHRPAITASERRAYREATEAAREPEGFLICGVCNEPIREGEENRHHRQFRSQGGLTTVENVEIVHGWPCHEAIHSHRTLIDTRAEYEAAACMD